VDRFADLYSAFLIVPISIYRSRNGPTRPVAAHHAVADLAAVASSDRRHVVCGDPAEIVEIQQFCLLAVYVDRRAVRHADGWRASGGADAPWLPGAERPVPAGAAAVLSAGSRGILRVVGAPVYLDHLYIQMPASYHVSRVAQA
jgi:hypothetical protein